MRTFYSYRQVHTFADNDKLKNIETIKTASGGSEVILSAQQEVLTITGDAGVDKITGGEGVDTIDGAGGDDIITIAAAGKGDAHGCDGRWSGCGPSTVILG